MAQTIINAIKLENSNAYLLTGIRGVGKTTTARLIAKALNCTKNFSEGEKCKTSENCHCKEIVGLIIDVLEMDAASKTGIDDIRELIENSNTVQLVQNLKYLLSTKFVCYQSKLLTAYLKL